MARRLFWILLIVTFAVGAIVSAHADSYKPDDSVEFQLAAEDWVSTKTARVLVNVEAAVSGNTAGSTRAGMTAALESLVKTEWRLVSFNRSQDSTGMERWGAMFEARVPENQLSGIHENAKKASKPGMQLSIANIDFSPTLEETQVAMGLLRTKIYKLAAEQLTALNTALPGRNYRIATIEFSPDSVGASVMDAPQVFRGAHGKGMPMETMVATAPAPASAPMERSEKLVMSARVVLATAPSATTGSPVPVQATPSPAIPTTVVK